MLLWGGWSWVSASATFWARWHAAWAHWWYVGPIVEGALYAVAVGFVITLCDEYDDWRRRSKWPWWVVAPTFPITVATSMLLFCWQGLQAPFIGYWLKLIPQGVEAVGFGLYEALVAIITNGLSRLYGTWVVLGLPGAGKGMYAAWLLTSYRRLYGDRIGIGTNLANGWRGIPERGVRGEDVRITGWRQMMELPLTTNKTWVFFIDEAQNNWGSREWAKFPKQLEFLTTQARKFGGAGAGVQLIITAQDWADLDPKLRRLAQKVIDVSNLFRGRWVHAKGYDGESGYRDGEDPLIGKPRKVTYRRSFIGKSDLRRSYNTYDLALLLNEWEAAEPEDPVQQLLKELNRAKVEGRRADRRTQELVVAGAQRVRGK